MNNHNWKSSLLITMTALFSPMFALCFAAEEDMKIRETDFDFSPEYGGSQGTHVEEIGPNRFRLHLGSQASNPQWGNNPQFRLHNAKGKSLVMVSCWPEDGSGKAIKSFYGFHQYAQSWSYDRKRWQVVHWERNEDSGCWTLEFPEFTEDLVHVSVQCGGFVYEDALRYIESISEDSRVSVIKIGESVEGRDLLRVLISDPNSDIPPSRRWTHYVANQHGGEQNARWRMVGMIDWLLSKEVAPGLQNNRFHFVLLSNPDGPANGWRRTCAAGIDMNRSYCPHGSNSNEQTKEAYLWQKDLEDLMGL